jgi:hypothetical protein
MKYSWREIGELQDTFEKQTNKKASQRDKNMNKNKKVYHMLISHVRSKQ